ncbi:MAG: hypothetical protein AAFY88_04465, partial [Acidobacteriota bacterium]
MRHRLRALLEPIPRENRQILEARWNGLPPALKTPAQALGRHLPHCGFVLGPAYCSFGCTHCYLPRNANKALLPSLEDMKAQVDANRRLLGHAGHLQITGGDVVDAYVRLLDPGVPAEAYNVASGVGTRIGDLIQMLGKHTTAKLVVRADPEKLRRPADA